VIERAEAVGLLSDPQVGINAIVRMAVEADSLAHFPQIS
jgi:hypothetical protein